MSEDCAAVEPLHSAFIDGELDTAEQVRVETHLGRCERCRHLVDSLRATRAVLRNLPPRRLPEQVVEPAHPVGQERRAGPSIPHRGPARARVATATAVALGLLGGAAYALGGQSPVGGRVVPVPLEMFVADHLVHTVGGPVSTPVVVDGGR